MKGNQKILVALALLAGTIFMFSYMSNEPQAQAAPSYTFDPTWPKQLPNNWKIGGITGLAVDSNDNVWAYNRPNDLTSIELHGELSPPIAECCIRPPSMIHFDSQGNVIGSFDAPQGHGMDVDSEGYVYLGQDTVRKYDPETGQVVAELARTPEREGGGQVGLPPPATRVPGQGTVGAVYRFLPPPARPAPGPPPRPAAGSSAPDA